MNLSIELTKQVKAHIDEVRNYLGALPADERQDILQAIESHIHDALESRSDGNPTPALLDAVIAEMDPPESYDQSPTITPRSSTNKPDTAPEAAKKSGMVRIMELFSDHTFKSPLAIRLINISALGFLGALGFLRALPFSGSYRCSGFFGFAGFFGLIGVAFIIELLTERKESRSTANRRFGLVLLPFILILSVIIAFRISKVNTPTNTSTSESKQPPVVAGTSPSNGDTAVDPKITELRVTFNKDMLTNRMWSWCIESQDTAPEFISEGTKFIDKRTCITPVELEPNKTYVVWINTQKSNAFRDIHHNPAVPYRLEFGTGNAPSNSYSLSANPIGHWQSVDFVSSLERFDPKTKSWRGDLYLEELTFLSDGKTDRPYWTWKDGILHHSGDNTDANFSIKTINGESYLFLEWMSGDVINKGLPPKYYVLKKTDQN